VTSRRGRDVVVALAMLAIGAAGVASTQPRLAATTKRIKETQDVYVLPPPAQLRIMTLGYRATASDFLFAKLLVEYGLHLGAHRPFDDLPRYLDAILAIEPDYEAVFRYVDTMLIFRPPRGTAADARLARGYLERGLAARPYDARLWLEYGQFLAFLAPSFLEEPAEIERWRVDGARAVMHAVELGADPDRAISAATVLSKAGDRAASIKSLQRAMALTDDPAERELIGRKLDVLQATAERESMAHDLHVIEGQWRTSFPFLSRGEFLIVGPPIDVAACAGRNRSAACARDWTPHLPSAAKAAVGEGANGLGGED
jgi:hypothetical protein